MHGDQALAWGALAAGVRTVSGYPGSPATKVFEALLACVDPDEVRIGWAPNEKVAMEIGIGASLAGARSLVVLKSVGLNVGLDPLATISYTGCRQGVVVLLGDDPGAWGSQNEQDSRWAARLAEVPIVEPSTVAQSAALMAQSFAWSEAVGTPIIVRITGGLIAAAGEPEHPWEMPAIAGGFVHERNRWITLPSVATRRHAVLHTRLRRLQAMLESSPYDSESNTGALGVLAVGHTYSKLQTLVGGLPDDLSLFALSSSWPLPERRLARWLGGRRRVLILEEGGPFVEEGVMALTHRHGLAVDILGRHTQALPEEGELCPSDLLRGLASLGVTCTAAPAENDERTRIDETPLCNGCPYLPTFQALNQAMNDCGGREHYIVVGETGCMVRGNLPPLQLLDVKYSLGSGLGLGLGLASADNGHKVVTLLGDSSFFHSDLTALPYAIRMGAPLVTIVLDNGTTALTGGQPHPGSRYDERGSTRRSTDIAALARACGAEPIVLSPHEPEAMARSFRQALGAEDFRFVIVRGDCPIYVHQTDGD